jgi:hypothetical protein
LTKPSTDWNTTGIEIDLSPSEISVFSRVGITAYFSGAITMPQVASNTTFAQFPTEDIGQPILMTRIFEGSDVVTTYSWGPFTSTGRGNLSVEEARELLLQTYSDVDFSAARDPADYNGTEPLQAVRVKQEDIREFRGWDYFPHFQSEDLANGIYDDYNALQGDQKTYWASGMNSFELVEFAIRGGKEIVDTYF